MQLAEKEHPDLILLDVVLPDMDGLEICRRLKSGSESKTMSVILMSDLRTAPGSRLRLAGGFTARHLVTLRRLARR